MKLSKKVMVIALCLTMVACTTDQVLADIDLLISIAGAIIPALGQLSPADAEAAQKISQIATDGMAVVRKDYDAVKASGAASNIEVLRAAINAVQTNLNEELAVIKVSNPALVGKVSAWVNLFVVTLNAISNAFPPGVKTNKKKLSTVPLPASIKSDWDTQVCSGDASCASLVKK